MTAASGWELDPEHEEFRASVRSFVDRHVRPVVEESDDTLMLVNLLLITIG